MSLDAKAEQVAHRHFAVKCFNDCWTYMEMTNRSEEDDRTMLALALASRWHWSHVDSRQPVNSSRSDWQVSRVYATLKDGKKALEYALSGLRTVQKNNIEDFDLAYAYESAARAKALLGNQRMFNDYRELAEEAGKDIADAHDREQFAKDLATLRFQS